MLKKFIGKITGRKILAFVSTFTGVIAGESLIDQFPSWMLLVLGLGYIFANVLQKFLLGWLELKKQS